MKHHKRTRSFGRDKNQRVALMKSLARSLVLHERITTTEAKAKELRPYVERLITRGKSKSLANTRLINEILGSETGTKKIVEKIAPKYEKRSGGYTRILKLSRRMSDGSPMAMIEFV
jgi:large subunit ribosomal protein L17